MWEGEARHPTPPPPLQSEGCFTAAIPAASQPGVSTPSGPGHCREHSYPLAPGGARTARGRPGVGGRYALWDSLWEEEDCTRGCLMQLRGAVLELLADDFWEGDGRLSAPPPPPSPASNLCAKPPPGHLPCAALWGRDLKGGGGAQ